METVKLDHVHSLLSEMKADFFVGQEKRAAFKYIDKFIKKYIDKCDNSIYIKGAKGIDKYEASSSTDTRGTRQRIHERHEGHLS